MKTTIHVTNPQIDHVYRMAMTGQLVIHFGEPAGLTLMLTDDQWDAAVLAVEECRGIERENRERVADYFERQQRPEIAAAVRAEE